MHKYGVDEYLSGQAGTAERSASALITARRTAVRARPGEPSWGGFWALSCVALRCRWRPDRMQVPRCSGSLPYRNQHVPIGVNDLEM
jgi:hypothetical protein